MKRDLLETIGELENFLEGQGTKVGTVHPAETLNHTTGQFQQKLHTCYVWDQSGWLQSKQVLPLRDLMSPHAGATLYCSLLPSMPHVGPPFCIHGPSTELWLPAVSPSHSGRLVGQRFSEPACRVGIHVQVKEVMLWALCCPHCWSTACRYTLSLCPKGLPEASQSTPSASPSTSLYRSPLLQVAQPAGLCLLR